VSATLVIPQEAFNVVVGEGAVWVDINPELGNGTGPGSLLRIDPTVNRVMATIPVGLDPNGIAVGAGLLWVANQGDGTVTRIDPQPNAVTGQPWSVGTGPADIVIAAGAAWVANNRDGTVVRINL
jgi:DNA-binding beta-propeller fold protein YncE